VFPIKDNIPTRRFPGVTVAIMVICTLVYFGFERGTLGLGDTGNQKVVEYGAIPYEVTHPGKECGETPDGGIACEDQVGVSGGAPDQPPTWITVFTSMFMHGSLLHLGGNMLFLWIFGNNIEDSMSRTRFAAFYILGGLAALAAQTLIGPNSPIPTVGASGAIAAVLGAYALLYPRARVVTVIFIIIFFTFIELPALVVLGLWFLIQLLYGAADLAQPVGQAGGGVAYWAHIGGFLFGLLAIKLFANRANEDYDRRQRIPVY
jgi:membrane associated rhomboid family serine protease